MKELSDCSAIIDNIIVDIVSILRSKSSHHDRCLPLSSVKQHQISPSGFAVLVGGLATFMSRGKLWVIEEVYRYRGPVDGGRWLPRAVEAAIRASTDSYPTMGDCHCCNLYTVGARASTCWTRVTSMLCFNAGSSKGDGATGIGTWSDGSPSHEHCPM